MIEHLKVLQRTITLCDIDSGNLPITWLRDEDISDVSAFKCSYNKTESAADVINTVKRELSYHLEKNFIGRTPTQDVFDNVRHAVYKRWRSLQQSEQPLYVTILDDHDHPVCYYASNTKYVHIDNVKVYANPGDSEQIIIKYDALLNDPNLSTDVSFKLDLQELHNQLITLTDTIYDI